MNESNNTFDYAHSNVRPETFDYLSAPIVAALGSNGAKRVLDLGCGTGDLVFLLNSLGFEAYGAEPSESGYRECVGKGLGSVCFKTGVYDDSASVPVTDFDAVVSTEVIEHLYFPRKLIEFAGAKLTGSGSLILTTPYHGYLKNLVLSLFDKWDSHHTPLWDGGHIKFWSLKTLRALLLEEDFEIVSWQGCGRVPFFWKSILIIARKRSA